ncbi:MAG TPA: serine hydrolase domain-containing protein [Saprospiraceae bacterium]|nr:serine hydrolase domain-containing protein [Saprospiraceae bacterium]
MRTLNKIISGSIIIAFIMNATFESNAQASLLKRQIEKILKYEAPVDFNVVPGILIGVADGDSTYQFTFGNDIHPEGIYELGSVTKPVVAWLVNRALDSLKQDATISVCTFLPDSLCTDSWRNVIIGQLLTHRAGLIRMPPGIGEHESDIKDPYKAYTMDRFANDLQSVQPVQGKYSYSNIGYAITNWLFQKTGGLQNFTTEKLNIPYSMKDTKWDYEPKEIAPGYGMDGRPQPPWNANALAPALGLKSSLHDMMTFIRILFEQYAHRPDLNSKPLKKEIKYLARANEFKVIDGWFVVTAGNSTLFYHTGRTGGHQVSICFIPHLRKGVIVFSNGALGSNDLSLLILRMLRKSHSSKLRIK